MNIVESEIIKDRFTKLAIKILNPFNTHLKSLLLLWVLLSFAAGLQAQTAEEKFPLIPYPTSLVPGEGEFMIRPVTRLVLGKDAAVFAQEAEQLQILFKNSLGKQLNQTKRASKNSIALVYDASIQAPEAYEISIGKEGVVLKAKEPAGMFRAVQSLRQLLPVQVEKGFRSRFEALSLPFLEIKDQPAYAWRGMHLDVSRHFFSTEYLKKFIELLALYKFNKFHLHLTDDQGWRIEIKKYPKLTSEGAWRTFNNQDSVCMERAQENPDFRIDEQHIVQRDGKTLYGGFYTQEEIKELVAYAAARHIEIVPEIDMPGHMMAAINAYPFLSCSGDAGWGKDFSIPVCPCNEATYTFAEEVFSEIIDLFPGEYIHLGADEVEKTSWEQSTACQELMEREGLKDVNELQSYFVHRMEKFFHSKGKKIIGWDEILEGGVSPSAYVMYWRSWVSDAPLEAARNGNHVIMTPGNPLYFDALPDKSSVYNVYHFKVVPDGFKEGEAKFIKGAQANIWTEYIPSENRAEYMYMPRMTALSEVLWTKEKQYDSYLQRLKEHYARLDALDVHYRLPDLSGFTGENVFVDKGILRVQKPLENLIIRYTTDGSLPYLNSVRLDQSLPVTRPVTIKMAAFTPGGMRGDVYTLRYKKQSLAEPVTVEDAKEGLLCSYYKGFFKNTGQIKGEAEEQMFIQDDLSVPAKISTGSFGLKYRGYLKVPETGIYNFYLTCDDGGVLRIANREVVNNDGLHPPTEKSGQVALKKGLHSFELDFVEGGGGYTLKLQYSKEGESPQDIPQSWFKY
jgi:hexosaminidase